MQERGGRWARPKEDELHEHARQNIPPVLAQRLGQHVNAPRPVYNIPSVCSEDEMECSVVDLPPAPHKKTRLDFLLRTDAERQAGRKKVAVRFSPLSSWNIENNLELVIFLTPACLSVSSLKTTQRYHRYCM